MQFLQPTACVNLPVSGRDSAILTAKDKILALVYASAQHGTWPFPMLEELPPFTMRKMHQPSMLDASFGRGMLLCQCMKLNFTQSC